MKAIFILLDSLNRDYLPIYGNDWVKAPNIQRLSEKGVVFDNHWLGSAPCMPARRDILTGRLNFLERGWGAIEPMDTPFTRLLRKAGIRSHMETDHYHYFHVGGENYHTQFDTYAFHRGQENDSWLSKTNPPEEPEHYETDPGQENNLAGTEIEEKYVELLKETMKKMDGPPSRFERLGL